VNGVFRNRCKGVYRPTEQTTERSFRVTESASMWALESGSIRCDNAFDPCELDNVEDRQEILLRF
jgi:hypothetical protein